MTRQQAGALFSYSISSNHWTYNGVRNTFEHKISLRMLLLQEVYEGGVYMRLFSFIYIKKYICKLMMQKILVCHSSKRMLNDLQ
jgi:hypothetical protein